MTYTTTSRVGWSIVLPGDECREIQIGGTLSGSFAPPSGGFGVQVDLSFQNTVVDTFEALTTAVIEDPTTCQLSATSGTLDFGAAASNTPGGITLFSRSGTRSYTGSQFDPLGSGFTFGTIDIGSNASSVQVSVTPPATLTRGSDSLPYSLNWSRRDTPGGSWFSVSGTTTTATPGTDDYIGLRLGGALNVDPSDDAGTYSNTMDVLVTCN